MATAPTRLIGVYDADGTARGEIAYFLKARVGAAHCALCDVTHGLVRERAEWKTCRDALGVPFVTYHRNDQPDAVRAVSGDRLPVVVAESSDGFRVLLGPRELAACEGSPTRLRAAIEHALEL